MDSTVEKIKEKLDIVELIGSYLKLQKTGINYRARCPFHSEKTPSFFVSPARQLFKCFGCGLGGDIFEFVKLIEGVEFGDALKILARRAGVKLPSYDPELRTARQRLYEIADLSASFFERQLEANQGGQKARKYLLKRGIKEETIKKWRLGYAPQNWRSLSDFLVGKGYSREEVVKTGLAVNPEEKNKTAYDRFRGRIIFPVFNTQSQVIGFGGRIFGEEEEKAKYLNTPNTLLYDKSKVLYGLNFAKVPIRKEDKVILTEGYTDVILSHQAGFGNTVASSGTSLTPAHLDIIKRYSDNLYTAFDMDSAGGLATQRSIEIAQRKDFNIRVIEMPKGKDPADMAVEDPKKWGKLVEEARDIFQFYFDNALDKFDSSRPEGKRKISEFILPKIKNIPNKIVQSHWIQKLSQALNVEENIIWGELEKIKFKREEAPSEGKEENKRERNRKDLLEERILSLIFKDFSNLELIKENQMDNFSEELKLIVSSLKKNEKKREASLKKLREGELKEMIDTAALRAEVDDFSEEDPKKEIILCLRELDKFNLRNKLELVSSRIKKVETEELETKEGKKKLKELINKFNEISRQLHL